MVVDPGIGSDKAEVGTREWAERVRLSLQSLVDQAVDYPHKVDRYVKLLLRHRGWTLMSRRDGSFFTEWNDFCASPKPYGLGVEWSKLDALISASIAKGGEDASKVVALGTVAPAIPVAERSPGRPGKAEKETSDNLSPVSCDEGCDREAERLRAILRAPEPIRDAFKAGIVSKAHAVKLGAVAFDTSPDLAATRAELVAKVSEVIAAKAPKTKPEKRAVAREVNALVKTALAAPAPDPVPPILRQLARLDVPQLERIVDEAQRLLLSKGNHAQT